MLQLDDLAAAYLAWKDGSCTLMTTNEKFTVKYVDIYGECHYSYMIHLLTSLKITSPPRCSRIFESKALSIGMSLSFDMAALHHHPM